MFFVCNLFVRCFSFMNSLEYRLTYCFDESHCTHLKTLEIDLNKCNAGRLSRKGSCSEW